MLSIIIPTLNAADTLDRTLRAVEGLRLVREIIVVDGGSHDFTGAIVKRRGLSAIASPPGRGRQLACGAAAAAAEWLLFLHSDTVLAPDWAQAAAAFMAAPGNEGRAAYFRFALDATVPGARRLERLAAWRCRRFGLPSGEQGLLLSRAFYVEAGGFRALASMEDVDLAGRIGRERLVPLDAAATIAATRYRGGGWLLRPALSLSCLGLYRLGVSPTMLARLTGD